MKTITTTLAILLTCLAPLAIGCSAPPGGESAETVDQAEIKGPSGATGQSDLEDAGYTCSVIGALPGVKGVITCVKAGAPTYTCPTASSCTLALTRTPPNRRPIHELPIGPLEGFSSTGG